METALSVVGWTAFALAIVAGLALDLVGLFGNWIILGAVAIAWAVSGFEHFSLAALLVLLVLAILGEALEAVLAGFGAKRFGGDKGTMVAAIAGAVFGAMAGTPILPIVGTLLGACAGAFVGAALYEYIQREKGVQQAVWSGVGATLGRIGGLFAKTFIGVMMLVAAWLML